MKQLGTLALKVLGFFAFVFAFWKWGETSAKLKASEKRADEAVKNSQDFEDINSEPYIDNPADLLDIIPRVQKKPWHLWKQPSRQSNRKHSRQQQTPPDRDWETPCRS